MDFTSLTAAGACDTMFYDSPSPYTHSHARTTTTAEANSTIRNRCALLVNTYLLIRRCSIYPPKTLIYFYTHELYIPAKSEITKFSSFSFASPQLWFNTRRATPLTHTLDTHTTNNKRFSLSMNGFSMMMMKLTKATKNHTRLAMRWDNWCTLYISHTSLTSLFHSFFIYFVVRDSFSVTAHSTAKYTNVKINKN